MIAAGAGYLFDLDLCGIIRPLNRILVCVSDSFLLIILLQEYNTTIEFEFLKSLVDDISQCSDVWFGDREKNVLNQLNDIFEIVHLINIGDSEQLKKVLYWETNFSVTQLMF